MKLSKDMILKVFESQGSVYKNWGSRPVSPITYHEEGALFEILFGFSGAWPVLIDDFVEHMYRLEIILTTYKILCVLMYIVAENSSGVGRCLYFYCKIFMKELLDS